MQAVRRHTDVLRIPRRTVLAIAVGAGRPTPVRAPGPRTSSSEAGVTSAVISSRPLMSRSNPAAIFRAGGDEFNKGHRSRRNAHAGQLPSPDRSPS